MKSSISKLVPTYNTARMVREYASRFYAPSIKMTRKMTDGDLDAAKALTAWKDRVRAAWPAVAVRDIRLDSMDEVAVGQPLKVSAAVFLGVLTPEDVAVELYYGPTSGKHEIDRGTIVRMKAMDKDGEGSWHFSGEIPTAASGAHAFAARVVPYNETMSNPYETSLVRWA
jgi:starch phosphorylase